MKGINESDFNGVYQELYELLGLEVTLKMHEFFRGQQLTFPMRLYSKSYAVKELKDKSISDSKYIAKKLGYSERG